MANLTYRTSLYLDGYNGRYMLKECRIEIPKKLRSSRTQSVQYEWDPDLGNVRHAKTGDKRHEPDTGPILKDDGPGNVNYRT